MNNEYYTNNKDYINRWVVSYADFVTMLLALFMIMYAFSQIDNHNLTNIQNKMQQTFAGKPNVTKYQANNQAHVEKIIRDNLSQSKSIKLLKSDKGLIIRVNNKVLFDEGSALIKPDAQKTLNEIVNVLTKIISVEHTI